MFWRRPPPPPLPFYRKPAVVSIILTVIIVFILGPVGIIFNGMTEELKKKADYETVILILKQQKENDDRQWEEIKNNRKQQQAPITPPQSFQIKTVPVQVIKGRLSLKDFKEYKNSTAEDQKAYRETRPDVDWSKYKKWTY